MHLYSTMIKEISFGQVKYVRMYLIKIEYFGRTIYNRKLNIYTIWLSSDYNMTKQVLKANFIQNCTSEEHLTFTLFVGTI